MSQAEGVVKFIRGAAGAGAGDVPDSELVQRFASANDEAAFRALVARYGPVVWSVCRRLVRNHHDAEDAFQATLLVFARKAGGLHSGAAIGGWLYAVAYRVASRVRSARRAEATEAEPAGGPPGGALDELTVREAEAALHEELARLPEKYRGPLLLCCVEGLSRDEAATRLGWSVNRVKHGLERGRELLRSRLARRGIALGVPLLTGLLASPASAVPPATLKETVRYVIGTAPPATINSLANGVTRTMFVAKWKWAVVGCLALALTGGTLAAVLRDAPEAPPAVPVAKPEFALAPLAPEPKPAPVPAPEPKKEAHKLPWDVATEYLSAIVNGMPEKAKKYGDKLDDRFIKEIQTAGLKSVKLVAILVNDSRVMVVTQREFLKRRPNAEPALDHVTVTLERKDADSPWLVRENDVADEKKVLREVDDFLEGKFNFKPDPKKANEKANLKAKEPRPAWHVAEEFLQLALAEKTADALKLVVPGTISENKVGEIKKGGFTATKPVLVLLNDTRVEVAFENSLREQTEKQPGHLVLMLTRRGEGPWQVKDIDARDAKTLEPRVQLYLGGKYNTPPAK
jgi:RNA polymerase sigma factor (sigma-70 family)